MGLIVSLCSLLSSTRKIIRPISHAAKPCISAIARPATVSEAGGMEPDAKALKVAPANFHRFSSFLKSDEELLRTIEHGVVFSPMHAWRGQLTDGEMQDVVAYIRLLAQQGR